MVFSHLNKNVEYPETREIDPEDIDHVSSLYLLEIYGKPHAVALGKVKYTFSVTYEIVYFPIYLVRNTKIIGKIGVYELERNRLLSVLDKNKEPRGGTSTFGLAKGSTFGLGEPIWFEKTTEEYMKKTHSEYEERESSEEKEVVISPSSREEKEEKSSNKLQERRRKRVRKGYNTKLTGIK